ncbi:MAG: HEAT repeat domain-containing protein, partial [Sandaracinaceae bacterium]
MTIDRWKAASAVLLVSTLALGAHTAVDAATRPAARIATSDGPIPAPSEFRRELRLAVQLPDTEEQELLDRLVTTDHAARAVALLEQIGLAGGDRSVPVVASMVEDRRRPVAIAAIETLGHLGTPAAEERLIELVESGRRVYQSAALGALADVGSARSLERLSSYANDPSCVYREAAIDALGASMRPEAEPLLVRLSGSDSPGIAAAAVAALAQLGTDSADAHITRLAREGRGHARVIALAHLPNTSSEETFRSLTGLLAGSDWHDARAITYAMTRSGRPEVVQVLAQCVRQYGNEVASACLQALPDVGTAEARAELTRLAESDGPAAEEALRALCMWPDAETIDLVERALRSPNPQRRQAALGALVSIGGPVSDRLLREVAEDPRAVGRARAGHCLAHRGTPRARDS